MPALACVDAAVPLSHGYNFAWDGPLPAPWAFDALGGAPTIMNSDSAASRWSTDLSSALYKIDGWGRPYFCVNTAGNITVRPYGDDTLPHQEIDLMKVVRRASDPKSAGGLGLQMPLIVRFPDVLKNRLESLQGAFDFAIKSGGYCSRYQGVYPVKSNQDRYIVEDIVEFGAPFGFGLEAGSKPELLLAMSCLTRAGSPQAFVICNGYKDEEYIELALLGRNLGIDTVIVLEEEEELNVVVETSRRLNVRPVVGIRAKLRTKHSGHFGSTSGEKGKFGLTTAQILSVAWKLKQMDMLDCLQLLHFHIGSMIPCTSLLSEGVGEAAQIYCELTRLGAGMRVFDIGGGLGIDYDGSHSAGSDMSVAYGLDEYAKSVVQAVKFACDQKKVQHPIICSESGRALVSHHSVLIFEAVSTNNTAVAMPPSIPDFSYFLEELTDDARSDFFNLMNSAMHGELENCTVYHDKLKRRCIEQFRDGLLSLERLAAVDDICELLLKQLGMTDSVKTYNVNLSIFTSMPDYWAIGQLFPIIPIHRLDQRPAVNGILSDLTCDSDGKVDRFIGGRSSLPLHELNGNGAADGGKYYLGMFLGGAYQEGLGGMHNLFGGPSVVRVKQSDGPHCFAVTVAMPGPSCADVLRAMQHEPELMFQSLKHRAEEYSSTLEGGEAVTCALAHAFNSMPYLVCSHGGGGVLTSDSDAGDSSNSVGAGAVCGVDEEDDDWEFMRCFERMKCEGME